MDTKARTYVCPVEVTIAVVGGKWKCLILWWLRRDARRFSELKLLIPRITSKVLTQQLRELEEDGLIYREAYPEAPPRVEYALTLHGQAFTPITELMCAWGKTHRPDYPFGYCLLENLRVFVASPEASAICAILETYRTVTIAATTIAEMFDLLPQTHVDALLIDLALLHDVDVQVMLTQMQQPENGDQKPGAIVALLPGNNSAERERAVRLGFPVHLPTPVETTELVSTISSLVSQIQEEG